MEHEDNCYLELKKKETFNWGHYLSTVKNEVSIDLARSCVSKIPDEFLVRCSNLQYLYLEGNELTELNNALFPMLKQLKWLDVRNNRLTHIPCSIVDHPSLQVLLLEGNEIEKLPFEIGSLSSLRGIQLAHNPIEYPPENVINQGVQVTIDYLRKQWHQLQSPQPIQLTHSQTKTLSPKSKPNKTKKQRTGASKSAVVLKVNSHVPRKPRKVQSGLSTASLSTCISVRPISNYHRPPPPDPPVIDNWTSNDHTEICSPINYERKRSIYDQERKPQLPHTHSTKTHGKIDDDDVQPKLLRDLWIEKIRQVLLTQEVILQRRKNAEALKQWQDEAKTLQQTQPKGGKGECDADITFPYDIDPDYLKMLTRNDLVREEGRARRDSSLHHIRHEEPINSKILSIIAALRELQMNQSATSISPRSEQRALAQEIKKIKDIQRSLNALKLKNFGQVGLSS